MNSGRLVNKFKKSYEVSGMWFYKTMLKISHLHLKNYLHQLKIYLIVSSLSPLERGSEVVSIANKIIVRNKSVQGLPYHVDVDWQLSDAKPIMKRVPTCQYFYVMPNLFKKGKQLVGISM